MFGIGLPEMILILALALIVVGPDKLPDLARSLAKTILDLKKTAENLKASFREEGNPLDEIRPELEDAARSLKNNLLEQPGSAWDGGTPFPGVNPPPPDSPQPPVAGIDLDSNKASETHEKEEEDVQNPPPAPDATQPNGEMTVSGGRSDDGK